MNMATPVWMVFSLSAYLTVDASPVRVRSLRGRLPLLYMPRATGSPVTVETWRHVILFCPAPFATRGLSRSLRGCHSNARVRNTILPSSIHFLSYLIFSLNFIFYIWLNMVWNTRQLDRGNVSEIMTGTMSMHILPRAQNGIQVQ